MAAATRDERQRWILAGGGALAVGAGMMALLSPPRTLSPEGALPSRPMELRTVRAEDADSSEAAALRDLTPLFLPTVRNAGVRQVPQREPGKTFFDTTTERLAFGEAGWNFDRKLPPLVTVNGKTLASVQPLDVLEGDDPGSPLAGFGRDKLEVPALPVRGGYLEVTAAGTGERVIVSALPAEIQRVRDKFWSPFEFMAVVDRIGLVAPLSLTTRSGDDEVDAFFRDYLTKTFRLGERLPPGFYRITVAP